MSTLYELTEEFKELLFLAEAEDLDEQTIKDTLESLNFELEDKADGYGKVIRELEGQVDIIESEIERLDNKARSISSNILNMKKALHLAMNETGNKRIKTDLFSFSVVKNGGKLPLDIHGVVPDEYKKKIIDYKEDSDKIRGDLEAGKKLNFAALKERGEHLRIR